MYKKPHSRFKPLKWQIDNFNSEYQHLNTKSIRDDTSKDLGCCTLRTSKCACMRTTFERMSTPLFVYIYYIHQSVRVMSCSKCDQAAKINCWLVKRSFLLYKAALFSKAKGMAENSLKPSQNLNVYLKSPKIFPVTM